MDNVMIRLDELSVRLGRRRVLRGLSCALQTDGRIIGLFGPNGAGKTTLLRTLVGLIGRYEGRLRIDQPESVAYLPDEPFLYPFLRLGDCVDLFATRYADFSREKAESIFDGLGLDAGLRVGECSRGMREQLHLGLLMAREARLYVFDEPLAAVDPLTREKLVTLILDHRAAGSGVLLSTHLIAEVEELVDEVLMLSEGELVLQAPVDELRRAGATTLEGLFKTRLEDR
jgi:ABC-2 type transport system ATP-binding protein